MKGFLDLLTVKFLTGFGRRPQHMIGGLGMISFVVGLVGLTYLMITWGLRIWYPDWFLPLHQRPLLIYSLGAVLLGAQMMSIGFLAELITAYMSKDEDGYSIADRTSGTSSRGAVLKTVNPDDETERLEDGEVNGSPCGHPAPSPPPAENKP
jgi:dolichol-phosphate mannosyltransferase